MRVRWKTVRLHYNVGIGRIGSTLGPDLVRRVFGWLSRKDRFRKFMREKAPAQAVFPFYILLVLLTDTRGKIEQAQQ